MVRNMKAILEVIESLKKDGFHSVEIHFRSKKYNVLECYIKAKYDKQQISCEVSTSVSEIVTAKLFDLIEIIMREAALKMRCYAQEKTPADWVSLSEKME